MSHFETPKVYVSEICIFLLCIATIFTAKESIIRYVPRTLLICFSALFILGVIDVLFFRTNTTLFGNVFRMQGVFLLWLLVGWSVITATIKIKPHPWLIVGCLIVQFVFVLLIDGGVSQRGVGTLGEPNALAAAVIFVWPWLFFTKQPIAVWMKVGALLLVLVIIVLSGSRSGVIALSLQAIFLILRRIKKITLSKSIIICLFLLLCTYVLPFVQHTGPYEDRSDVWQSAALSGLNHPFLGYGFGNTEVALNQENKVLHNNLQDSYVDSSHNLFLDWWVQGGVFGLGILLTILGFVLRQLIQRNQFLQLTLLLGLLAVLSFNPASVVTLIAFWWVIGQSFSDDPLSK